MSKAIENTKEFVRVASTDDLPPEKAMAVRVGNRSVALFNHNGRFYATDNQCPHMGYPLIRGRTRNGVLQCDWHGWSYAMDGGGCFTGGCDDLDTFAVRVENGSVYVQVAGVSSKRTDSHYLLLKEALLSRDNWILSKAIAIMLAQGVSEEETFDHLIEHLGKHIASDHGANGAFLLNQLLNGIAVSRRLEKEDRLIPLMIAAKAASGRAGDRIRPQPLPGDLDWERLASWTRMFSRDRMWEGIEKCLITARNCGSNDSKIIPLLYDCVLEPSFLMFSQNVVHIGDLAELIDTFGWELCGPMVCNLGAKVAGRNRGTPQGDTRDSIEFLNEIQPLIEKFSNEPSSLAKRYDESMLAECLFSGDLKATFNGVTHAFEQGAHVSQLVDTMVMLAGDRMARTPASFSPGWFNISNEMQLSSSIRRVLKYGTYQNAINATYFAAWHFYQNRWLNLQPSDLLRIDDGAPSQQENSTEACKEIVEHIESIRTAEVAGQVRAYLRSDFDPNELLTELALTILKHDTGTDLLGTLRTVLDEYGQCSSHPARNKLLIGIARFATDVRQRNDNDRATRTARRFARRETADDMF
ncbi:MAG: Rieske (2Fe-2S) protein [Gammaproteobacteria bacterium]|nr:Rieske (2Fe-2S) protein [Gammaproteobacteria bacterium]MYD79948.1 Rieske (2Fe-2S) protein [Gammaproteobacteria bacterium]